MKKCIILFFAILLFSNLFAQHNNQGIMYYFGNQIDTLLKQTYGNLVHTLEDNESFAIACSDRDTLLYVSLVFYCNNCDIYDGDGEIDYWRGFLVKNTNRYYLLENKNIPVILDELDSRYGVIKLLEGGGVRQSARIVGEFEPRIVITADQNGRKIYSVKSINIGNR